MWPLVGKWACGFGVLGLAVAIALTACVLRIHDSRLFWEVVGISDYLFPAHGLILVPPDSPAGTLVIAYLIGFLANATFYAIVGLIVGYMVYAVRNLGARDAS